MASYQRDVRFTPDNGHSTYELECPLCAISRHAGFPSKPTLKGRALVRVLELPASPRVNERLVILEADWSRDLQGLPCVGHITAIAIGLPMARYHAGLEVVDCDHVGTAIAGSRRRLDEVGSTGR